MPAPSRVDHPSKLTDEALYCHCFGHHWWVSQVKRTAMNIGKTPQDRQYYACSNGCKSRKRCLIDTETGERWGWSSTPGENYGTVGGWTKVDFIMEWLHRQATKQLPGMVKQVEFEFNDDTFMFEPKSRGKRRTG